MNQHPGMNNKRKNAYTVYIVGVLAPELGSRSGTRKQPDEQASFDKSVFISPWHGLLTERNETRRHDLIQP